MTRLLTWLTVDQWRAIDEAYRTRSLPSLRAAAVLIAMAVGLILPHYMGQIRFIHGFPELMSLFSQWPYPKLYPRLYWALFKLVNYGLVPILCIKLVLRERIRDHGLRFVREPRVWALYIGMVVVVMPFVVGASLDEAFLNTYPKYENAAGSWTQLIAWELGYALQFFMLEFFFRGFVIFALARYIGALAIFVMVVPYSMIHFGKPPAECVGSVLAGIALGTIALRTGSIYGGVLVHCIVAWAMDILALNQKGQLDTLLQ